MNMGNLDEAVGDLISAQLSFGKEALKIIGDGLGSAMDSMTGMDISGKSCCDIPEPCWMPLNLGEICCSLCPGDVGEICLIISNEDFREREYEVVAATDHSAPVSISNSKIMIGPKERRLVSVKFTMPVKDRDQPETDSCCECNDYETVIWVLGCRNHYLRWYVNNDEKHSKCCHEVCVIDQPDYELHWYDHFHVAQPCYGPLTVPKR
jgi:hypothetical protein